MNSYKLNGTVGHLARMAINEGLDIVNSEIYKVVKSIDNNGIITTKDDKKYKLKLVEIDEPKGIDNLKS